MNTKRLAGIVILILIFIMGCSGTKGKLKTQSESESKVSQLKLMDSWSDYDIRYRRAVLVFDPKYDDRKILLGGKRGWWWTTIEDQESWKV